MRVPGVHPSFAPVPTGRVICAALKPGGFRSKTIARRLELAALWARRTLAAARSMEILPPFVQLVAREAGDYPDLYLARMRRVRKPIARPVTPGGPPAPPCGHRGQARFFRARRRVLIAE
jgi:hypothetical protein